MRLWHRISYTSSSEHVFGQPRAASLLLGSGLELQEGKTWILGSREVYVSPMGR